MKFLSHFLQGQSFPKISLFYLNSAIVSYLTQQIDSEVLNNLVHKMV